MFNTKDSPVAAQNLPSTESGIQSFSFDGAKDVQVVIINYEPWFVATDVCSILGLQNISDRLKDCLDDDEYLPYQIDRAGQRRTVNIVSESGLYALIIRSNKSIARKFRKWVTSEILPSIRKTGQYATRQVKQLPQRFTAEPDILSLSKQYPGVSVTIGIDVLIEFGRFMVSETKRKMEDLTTEKFLTPKKTAELLDVDVSTLWRWNKIDYLKPCEIGGKRKYRMSDINKILGV
jgi:prophage antirepressor-like protein